MTQWPPSGGHPPSASGVIRSLKASAVAVLCGVVLAAETPAQTNPAVLACGEPTVRSLVAGAVDTFMLSIPDGETAVIDVAGLTGDIGLIRVSATNGNGSVESCAGSLAVVGDGGATLLEVSDCFENQAGQYAISANLVSQSNVECGRRQLGCGIVPGAIETPGAVVPYAFNASAGDTINLLVTRFGTTGRPARLRLFAPNGELLGSESCSGSVRATFPESGLYSVLVSTCSVPEEGPFTMLREGSVCPEGPVITYFGVSRSDDIPLQPDTFDAVGRPVYIRPSGSGFSLIVEARPGVNGRQPGTLAFNYDANDPTLLPDVQILLSRPIGFGTPAVCDILPPQQAGVPPPPTLTFDGSEDVSRVVNDLGCRFNDGEGMPLGRTSSEDACTRTPVTLDFAFVDPSTSVQFCGPIARAWAFPPGDTVIKARVRDIHENYGAEREIVVRANGDSPFFLSDVPASELIGTAGKVFFRGEDSAHGAEIWATDATRDGTAIARDIIAGPASSSPRNLVSLADEPYFVADVNAQTARVWPVNGLPISNAPVNRSVSPPHVLTVVGDRMFFFGDAGGGALDLWTSDGNSNSAALVTELATIPLTVDSAVASNGQFFFALRGIDGNPNVAELWRSDGTMAGTERVQRFSFSSNSEGSLDSLTDLQGTLFFVAGDRRFGYGLWRSDGSEDGTEPLRTFAGGPSELTPLEGTLLFGASDSAHGNELWKSDGTTAGTQMVVDINPGAASASPHSLAAVNRRVYFAANNGSSGIELWTSNGTASGTRLVKDINPGPGHANPDGLIGIDGALFFAADDGRHGSELWISDGTETSTVLALDIDPSASSEPMSFTRLSPTEGTRGAVVFVAQDQSQNPSLWSVPLLDSIVVPIVCPGDCDGNDLVTVNELVRGVSTSLGISTASCTAMDRNNDGRVTIEELVTAVNSALHGCG